MITTAQELKSICLKLSKEPLLAFDTEFVREHTYLPELALIQIAGQEQAYLIDPICLNKEDLAPLLELLQAPKILKVLHAAYGDQECLHKIYGITASPILDTLEAASLLGLGESISLADLLKRLLGVSLPKHLTRTHWKKRPLSPEMLRYAEDDVRHLIALAKLLEKELKKLSRWQWCLELSAKLSDPKIYEDPIEAMAQRLAKSKPIKPIQYGSLKRLLQWREKRAQDLNIPRRRLADDVTLVHMARSQPKSLEQLANFRGLNKGEVKKAGVALLEMLQAKQEDQDLEVPKSSGSKRLTAEDKSVVSFLGTFIKCLCQDFKLANRLVMTTRELETVVAEKIYQPEQWVERGLIHPEACKLVGNTLAEALMGKKRLGIEKGKLKVF